MNYSTFNVRLPLRTFAGEGAQGPRFVADAPRAVVADKAPDSCTCFLTAPCSFCTRFADRDLPEE